MGGEGGAGARGRVRIRLDWHRGGVAGAHERPPQGFDAVVDMGAEYLRGDIEPWRRGGVGGDVGVLADHVLWNISGKVGGKTRGRDKVFGWCMTVRWMCGW